MMPVQFAVLASGSSGNSALVRGAGAGLLIDVGIGPRSLGRRLDEVGSSPGEVGAVVLTHTHGDHVRDHGLVWMIRHGVRLFCHEGHVPELRRLGGFAGLARRGLVTTYDDRPFPAAGGMHVEPIELKHDGGPTFGFRVETKAGRRGKPVSVGYVADTGCWWDSIAEALTDVEALGIEFNHDVDMQVRSGRPPRLIRRVLGDRGHLSNAQGAELLSAVLKRSARGAVKDVVLLHLSRQCNLPALAIGSASEAVRGVGRGAKVHAAEQDRPSPVLAVTARRRAGAAAAARTTVARPARSLCLPFEAA